jgi:hypothetical protein
MKKKITNYLVCWFGMLILFNIISFITPNNILGENKYDDGFWIAYAFVTVAFILHLLFSCILLKKNTENAKVVNMPIVMISNIEMLIMLVVGICCMLIPGIPTWVGVIVCYLVLFLSVAYIIATNIVVENSVKANKALNKKTFMFRSLADDAQVLINRSTTPEIEMLTKKVYDSIRYSDSISSNELIQDELRIQKEIKDLCSCMSDSDVDYIKVHVECLLDMIEARNNKCKLLKRQA